ncbi:M1 family metallopeptidase [Arthrobacter rhombi]|uniref:M1 family metallopeptidase n=1 Tax=Arthrobacter rhombi TaxID=71253 RepID=UPI0031DDAEC7
MSTHTTPTPAALPDPYVPESGSAGYRVLHYALDLSCKLAGNRLDGRAVITAVAVEELARIEVDLIGLQASKVQVNGKKAAKYSQRRGKLLITPAQPVAAGAELQLDIRYGGTPQPRMGTWGDVGWEELEDGVLVAGQPNGAATWFPCNDHPSQKATFELAISTDAGYRAISNGELVAHGRTASQEHWRYRQAEPMATYLATLQIGRYTVQPLEPEREEDPHQTAFTPAVLARRTRTALKDQPRMMATFIEAFGPYPFDAYAVVVTEDELEIPLEAQGLSIIGRNHLAPGWEQQRLIAHELSHQWFGNSLTASRWQDIWMHEGFACYAEWIWSDASGGLDCAAQANAAWELLAAGPQDLEVGRPGAEDMFDDRVYKRGALAVHALRCAVGDAEFFSTVRAWVAQNRHGSVDYPAFAAFLEARGPAGFDADAVLSPWLFQPELPPMPAAAPTPR